MRKLLTALSFAALTMTMSPMAVAQGDFLGLDLRLAADADRAHVRSGSPIQQVGDRTNDTLINHPEPQGSGNGF